MNWRTDRLQLLDVAQSDSAEGVSTAINLIFRFYLYRDEGCDLETSRKWPSKLINRDRRRRDNRAP